MCCGAQLAAQLHKYM